MVDEIRIDHILQIAAPVIWQENIHRLRAFIGAIACYAVVHAMYYVWMRRE